MCIDGTYRKAVVEDTVMVDFEMLLNNGYLTQARNFAEGCRESGILDKDIFDLMLNSCSEAERGAIMADFEA